MRNILSCMMLLLVLGCSQDLKEKRLLIIYDGQAAAITQEIEKLMAVSAERGIKADTSTHLSIVNEDTLRFYSAVLFLGKQKGHLDYRQHIDLERYAQAGGGIIGVGTTIAPQYQWPWHAQLMEGLSGAGNKDAQIQGTEKITFQGGHIAFISSLMDYSADSLADILTFAIADNRLDYRKATSLRVPDESHFTKIVLDDKINEPMELDVMPDGKVIYIQRRGEVKLYDPEEREVKLLATFDVTTEGNYEDGLLGVALDPLFERTRWVYFYYSAPEPDSVNRLSRFYMAGDSLIMSSEKMILEVPVQRYTCCHSGGSIQFGPDGLLYLSTGDNTSSKESDGYTPIDERPGRSPYDAQKSSSNTQDLRGKILRIKINDDGSYSIPENNLFAKDGKEGRPEIYVMGVRNPFRISIDWKTGWLYWGDVGPDAGKTSAQGTESYDEWNQAREAGNYGWPYFVGNNIAYPAWDFDINTPGAYFDPQNSVNNSPNNYGSKVLPQPQPAMIWYPYGESEIWPNLGTGSRSAMAGPVYYSDLYRNSEVKFPAYYDGKLFIYEWARSWIKVVSFDKEGHPVKIEPFMPEWPLSKPIDLEFGPDGAMYVLEYGMNYFADNDDARLVKIEYTEGNRKPIANITVDEKAGGVPFTVQFSGLDSYDYDPDDALSYAWKFTGDDVQSTAAETTYTFDKVGVYTPTLIVTDNHGNSTSTSTKLLVGNAPPVVDISFVGNQSFYYNDERLSYTINVSDPEDGSVQNNTINPAEVQVSFDYLRQSKDLALLGSAGRISPYLEGSNLIEGSDCRSCHDMEKQSIGPSYKQVADRYHGDPKAINMLAEKIILGGRGNWGESLMAAHPQLSEKEAKKMVEYILSLAETDNTNASIPLKGSLSFKKHSDSDEEGVYYLSVSYTDKGANGMPAITSRKMATFRNPKVQAESYELFKDVSRQRPSGGDLVFVADIQDGSYIAFKDIDLTGITAITYNLAARPMPERGKITLKLDSPNGTTAGEILVKDTKEGFKFKEITAPITKTNGVHDLYFIFSHDEVKGHELFQLDWLYFHQ